MMIKVNEEQVRMYREYFSCILRSYFLNPEFYILSIYFTLQEIIAPKLIYDRKKIFPYCIFISSSANPLKRFFSYRKLSEKFPLE